MSIRNRYYDYRSFRHTRLTSVILACPLWWWIVLWPIILNVILWGGLYVIGGLL